MTDAVRVRPATADDRPAIAALLDGVLGPHPYGERLRLWAWRTAANPARPDDFPEFLIAEAGGAVAGVHGLIPLRFQVAGDTVLAACSCDFAVAPNARGAGLPLKIAAMAPALSAVPLSTSANEAAGRLTVALKGAMFPPAAIRYLRPIRLGGFLSHRLGGGDWAERVARGVAWGPDRMLGLRDALRRRGLPRGAEVEEVTGFDASCDDLWERLRAVYPVGVVRDAQYLNWRYRDYPFGGVRAFVARQGDRADGVGVVQLGVAADGLCSAAITELMVRPDRPAMTDLLLADLVRAAARSGADYAVAFAPTPDAAQALARAGFRRRLAGRSPYTYKANRPSDRQRLNDFDAWHFSLGDGDAAFFYASRRNG